jgi:hypothetical protein
VLVLALALVPVLALVPEHLELRPAQRRLFRHRRSRLEPRLLLAKTTSIVRSCFSWGRWSRGI